MKALDECPDCSDIPCECGLPNTSAAAATEELQSVDQRRLVQRLLVLLDMADDLLSTRDVLLDGWPAAREWHAEYETLPLGEERMSEAQRSSPSSPGGDSSLLNDQTLAHADENISNQNKTQ